VEAPTEGSVILAGILIKCGGYGFILILFNFKYSFFLIGVVVIIVSIIGFVYIPMICLIVSDRKKVVAYSSIVHIRMPIVNYIRLRRIRMRAIVIIIFSHGLVSPLIFIYIDIKKAILGSRNIELFKGSSNYYIFII